MLLKTSSYFFQIISSWSNFTVYLASLCVLYVVCFTKLFRNLGCENQSCQWWSHSPTVKITRFLQKLRKLYLLHFYFFASLSQLENISFKSKNTNNTTVSQKLRLFKRNWDKCTLNSYRSQSRYPGPRGFLVFFIGKFCDANRFF